MKKTCAYRASFYRFSFLETDRNVLLCIRRCLSRSPLRVSIPQTELYYFRRRSIREYSWCQSLGASHVGDTTPTVSTIDSLAKLRSCSLSVSLPFISLSLIMYRHLYIIRKLDSRFSLCHRDKREPKSHREVSSILEYLISLYDF